VHNADGSLAYSFDLGAHGFPIVGAVNYLALTDELAFTVQSNDGIRRVVVTDLAGNPRRSYRVDGFGGVVDLAQITTGPHAGQAVTVVNQPTFAFRFTGL
jgi:hypothetical protein